MDRSAPDELVEESADMSAFNTFGWINDTMGKYKRTKPILTPRFIPNMKIGLGSDVAGGQTESVFRAITDAIGASKMYLRYVDEDEKAVTFEEAFYMATKGGGEFFGKVVSFEEGYQFDALILDDSILAHPLNLSLRQRLERSIYLSLDLCGGIKEKYIQGNKII